MLFKDNNLTFAFPIGNTSLFVNFYEVRDSNSPAKPSVPQVESRIVKGDGSEIEERHSLIDAEFISSALLKLFENLVLNGNYKLPTFLSDRVTVHYKILPNIYLRLTDLYYENCDEFEDSGEEAYLEEVEGHLISLSANTEIKQKAFSNEKKVDLSSLYDLSYDYNLELFKRLKKANLWEEYCEKRNLDVSITEQTLNEIINSFDFVLKSNSK
jgi:hypothetical protein